MLDCETLSQVDEERLTEVFPSISWVFPPPNQQTGGTPCPGCVLPVGELSDASTGTGAIQGACAPHDPGRAAIKRL